MGVAEKTDRNRQIVHARKHGLASLEELSEEHGVSVERIRQISKNGGVSHAAASAAYTAARRRRRIEEAEKQTVAILMRYSVGASTKEIGSALDLPASIVQEIINENITDELVAARSANIVAATHPDLEERKVKPRDDRHWTAERVLAALVRYARTNQGQLPSSIEYQKISPGREDLPSFATARNRLGRWSQIRVQVNNALKG